MSGKILSGGALMLVERWTRNVSGLVAANATGLPALSAGPAASCCAVAVSRSATRALIPTATTAIAPASATDTILRWVARSAPIRQWVIGVLQRGFPQGRAPTARSDTGGADFFAGWGAALAARRSAPDSLRRSRSG